MYFHFKGIQISFISEVAKSTKLRESRTIQVKFHHFGFVSWISCWSTRLKFPIWKAHKISPSNRTSQVTGLIWRGPYQGLVPCQPPLCTSQHRHCLWRHLYPWLRHLSKKVIVLVAQVNKHQNYCKYGSARYGLIDWLKFVDLSYQDHTAGTKAQHDIRVNRKKLLTNLYHQHLSPPSVFSFDLQYFELCVINNTLPHKCL